MLLFPYVSIVILRELRRLLPMGQPWVNRAGAMVADPRLNGLLLPPFLVVLISLLIFRILMRVKRHLEAHIIHQ
jgi:hypothetical protein